MPCRPEWLAERASVEDVIGSNIKDRFEAFQWDVQEIDGHDIDAIREAVDKAKAVKENHVIICDCVKGKGVSYMERMIMHGIKVFQPMNSMLWQLKN